MCSVRAWCHHQCAVPCCQPLLEIGTDRLSRNARCIAALCFLPASLLSGIPAPWDDAPDQISGAYRQAGSLLARLGRLARAFTWGEPVCRCRRLPTASGRDMTCRASSQDRTSRTWLRQSGSFIHPPSAAEAPLDGLGQLRVSLPDVGLAVRPGLGFGAPKSRLWGQHWLGAARCLASRVSDCSETATARLRLRSFPQSKQSRRRTCRPTGEDQDDQASLARAVLTARRTGSWE